MSASAAILRPSLEKITGRIAVSEYARDTLVQHIGGEPVVIPNGVYVDQYARAAAAAGLARRGRHGRFVGPDRRAAQGSRVMLRGVRQGRRGPAGPAAAGRRRRRHRARRGPRCPPPSRDQVVPRPGHRRGQGARHSARPTCTSRRTPAGRASASSWWRRWPPVPPSLASDIPAFRRVLDGGPVRRAVPTGDVGDLAGRRRGCSTTRPSCRAGPRRRLGVRRYDWATVATRIVQVYETVTEAGTP